MNFPGASQTAAFVEWAQVHDHRYGTLVQEVEQKLSSGSSLILEIDVQGALNVERALSGFDSHLHRAAFYGGA